MGKTWGVGPILVILSVLIGCDAQAPATEQKRQSSQQAPSQTTQVQTPAPVPAAETVLPYLNIKPQPAAVVMPQCQTRPCTKLELNSLHTQDAWLNHWLSQRQAQVIAAQIQLNGKDLSLQQVVNRYVKASAHWKNAAAHHQPYHLNLNTQLGYQKNGYVLVQLQINSVQGETQIKDRVYFFVANRHTQQSVELKHIVAPKQQQTMNQIMQSAYQAWKAQQQTLAISALPEKLTWQTAEWFYDQQGIGLHFRSDEIAPNSPQWDLYLTAEQTRRVLKPDVYQALF